MMLHNLLADCGVHEMYFRYSPFIRYLDNFVTLICYLTESLYSVESLVP